VKIRKEDMNKLVMNYLVTEGYVDAAEKFQLEAGVKREQQPLPSVVLHGIISGD
jgi:2-phosphoglycerate kinase